MQVSYNWLQSYFHEPLPSTEVLVDVLERHAFEVERVTHQNKDVVIDIDVLPNRAHDCLSHYGVAHELAVLLNRSVITDRYASNTAVHGARVPMVTVADERCRRYLAREIDNLRVGPSPDWLRERLEAIGQRSINAIVDATNYVMFDLGNPIHAFDADRIVGGITIRRAREGEVVTTLGRDQQQVTCVGTELVIADDEGVLALAGIKGSTKAEVTSTTKRIVLEVANFDPKTTRETRMATGIQTDSSKRFEHDLSVSVAPEALEAVTALIVDIAGTAETVVGAVVDRGTSEMPRTPITITTEEIEAALGTNVPDLDALMDRFDWEYTKTGSTYTIVPPATRLDLSIPADIIEEIARVFGYDQLPAVLPTDLPEPVIHEGYSRQRMVKRTLVEAGCTELQTYTFRSDGVVRLENELASNKNTLRSSLAPGFLEAMELNVRNRELVTNDDLLRVFEIGTVFESTEKESVHLIVGIESFGAIKAPAALQEILAHLLPESPQQYIVVEEKRRAVCEVPLDILTLEQAPTYPKRLTSSTETYVPFSPYPYIVRDIAIWLPSDDAVSELEELLRAEGGELLAREPRVIDTFAKDGRISVAFRLVFQSPEKTLTDETVNTIMDRLYQQAQQKTGWEVR